MGKLKGSKEIDYEERLIVEYVEDSQSTLLMKRLFFKTCE